MNKRLLSPLLVLGGALAALPSGAAVDVAPTGFLVRQEVTINAPQAQVYGALLGQPGSWWNQEHTYSGDSANLSIEARPGGCFCERLPNGGWIEHARVIYVAPSSVVRMIGSLGPLQPSGVTGALTWKLSASAAGTRLELSYSVGGFMAGGFDKIAPAVDRVLGDQVQRLRLFIETGSPVAR